MSSASETFFTTIGCMDGRVQEPVAEFGRKKFGAAFPDTITEAGLVGQLAKANADGNQGLLDALTFKAKTVSLEKHASRGMIVHGHQECAGNPVEDEAHKDHIRASVAKMKELIGQSVPIIGVFVQRSTNDPQTWIVEELSAVYA